MSEHHDSPKTHEPHAIHEDHAKLTSAYHIITPEATAEEKTFISLVVAIASTNMHL